jgi:hypothetical protein
MIRTLAIFAAGTMAAFLLTGPVAQAVTWSNSTTYKSEFSTGNSKYDIEYTIVSISSNATDGTLNKNGNVAVSKPKTKSLSGGVTNTPAVTVNPTPALTPTPTSTPVVLSTPGPIITTPLTIPAVTTPSPVPLPGALPLLGFGIAGLTAVAHRRKKAQKN